LFIYMFII